MPEGRYRIFADVVHGTGFPETEIGSIALPAIVSGLPQGDDALAMTASVNCSKEGCAGEENRVPVVRALE